MIVSPDGSYKASTIRGSTTEGQFFLQDGKLRYRSSRTMGAATLSEDRGKTTLTVLPEDPNHPKIAGWRRRQKKAASFFLNAAIRGRNSLQR